MTSFFLLTNDLNWCFKSFISIWIFCKTETTCQILWIMRYEINTYGWQSYKPLVSYFSISVWIYCSEKIMIHVSKQNSTSTALVCIILHEWNCLLLTVKHIHATSLINDTFINLKINQKLILDLHRNSYLAA